ncbi:hypothetical protein SO694_00016457 [Aureococcus anophagefferens]|uniref:CHORD domain-containing protein n=1 Tax=Aureococcus anophagefferens TaxID=44056 RepID=A0ABR1G227_AURAN
MKLFVSYKEGEDEAHHMATKFTVPKGWRPGPVAKLLGFSVDTYNAKHKDHLLNVDEVHFAKKDDDGNFEAIGLEDVVEQVLKTKDEVFIAPGTSNARSATSRAQAAADAERKAAEEAEAKRVFAIGKVRCKNFGCNQLFDPDDNPEGGCHHRVSPPFFHDCNKGWTCCPKKSAMDWEDFQKLPTCAVGRHSAEPPEGAAEEGACGRRPRPTGEVRALRARQVHRRLQQVRRGQVRGHGRPVLRQVHGDQGQAQGRQKYDDGSFRCQHKGCQAKFHPDDNGPRACSYHYGTPVFHETMKWGLLPAQEEDGLRRVHGRPRAARVGYHWNGEGDDPEPTARAGAPPPIADDDAEVVEAGDEGFDLG